jgi:hypothetical protein
MHQTEARGPSSLDASIGIRRLQSALGKISQFETKKAGLAHRRASPASHKECPEKKTA